MKKIYLAFLIVVGSLFICGNAQTVSSGGGKLTGSSNELLSSKFKLIQPGCVALAAREGKINLEKRPGNADPETDMKKGTKTGSQLDSVTMQMADAAIVQMEEQARIALQDSVSKSMENYPVQDREIAGALKASKHGADSVWDGSGSYLRQPTPIDILKIVGPGLLADRESFAVEILAALVRCNVNPAAPPRQATE